MAFLKVQSYLALLMIAAIAGCVSPIEPGEPLGAGADDDMPGPGFISGKSGVFKLGESNKKVIIQQADTGPDLSRQSLQATSDVLDQKIKQLEQQQKELEQLKLDVQKQLKIGGSEL